MGGEGLYYLETKYGNQIRDLLDCVAQHKPLPRPESFHRRTSADRASTAQDFYVNVPAVIERANSLSRSPPAVPISVSSPARLDTMYENMPTPSRASSSSYQNCDLGTQASISTAQSLFIRDVSPSSAYDDSDVAGVYAYVDSKSSYVNVHDKRTSGSSDSQLMPVLSPTSQSTLLYIPVEPVSGSPKGRQQVKRHTASIEYTEVDIEATQALNASVKQHDLLREQSLSQIKS
jgi:hypothetical protein